VVTEHAHHETRLGIMMASMTTPLAALTPTPTRALGVRWASAGRATTNAPIGKRSAVTVAFPKQAAFASPDLPCSGVAGSRMMPKIPARP
jgi:hypothetical protein